MVKYWGYYRRRNQEIYIRIFENVVKTRIQEVSILIFFNTGNKKLPSVSLSINKSENIE